MAPTISLHNEQYSAPIPAHRFRQGGRDVYCFSLDLATLDGLLPQRVDDAVIREANRRLTPSHARNIQKYLEERDDWLLGAMLLGIARDALDFEPYEDETGELYSKNFGQLRIRNRRLNTMRIFDGQHRRRAIQDTLTVLENDRKRADKLASLEKSSVPIVLYAEEEIAALRQMFADASKTKRIEGNVVAQFNQRDAFNMAAMHLAENSKLFGGRVEMDRTTVARGSQRLLSINQLADILRTSELGYEGRNTRNRNDAYALDIKELYDRCLTWSDQFLPAARKEYAAVTSGEVDDRQIPQQRAESFAYSVTFFRIVAGCYHDWRVRCGDWKRLAEFLREASLEPGAGNGTLLVDAGLVLPDGLSLLSRRQEVAAAIKYIAREATAMLEQADNQVVLATPVTVVAAALERPGGVSVSAAAAEASITPSEVRSIIDGLRRKGAVITALGDGIFRGGGPGARPRGGRATPGTTVTKPTATSGRRTHTPRQLQIVWKGQELTFPTHIDALVEILKRLADQYDGALDKLRNVGGRVRPLIAPTSDQLYPGRTDLAETFSREFTRGWFVGTNYSHSDVRRLLRAAVESVGLDWDVEVYFK